MSRLAYSCVLLLFASLGFGACRCNPRFCEGALDNNCDNLTDVPQRCTSNEQCEEPTAVCDVTDSMTCVQCTPDQASACSNTTPACGEDRMCRACRAHSECPGSDACLPDGSCADSGQVAYVQAGGMGIPPCAKGAPCGTLQEGITAVNASRPYIKVSSAGVLTPSMTTTIDGKAVIILADPGAKLDRMGDGVNLEVRNTGADVQIYDLEISGAQGEYAVIEALPALLRKEGLVHACDMLLELYARNPLVYARLVDILRGAPESPPSRFLERMAVDFAFDGDTLQFQYAVPYLLERNIAVDRVRSHRRALARADPGAPRFHDDTVMPLILPDVLLHDPALGRVLAQRALGHRSELSAREAAAMLVAIAAPWCIMLLRSIPPSVPHFSMILGALRQLGVAADAASARLYGDLFVSTRAAAARDAELRIAIDRWHLELGRFPPEHRALLARHWPLMQH